MLKFIHWNRSIWLVLCIFPSYVYAIGNAIEQSVRDMYLPTINAMCHSSTEYTLDMPFEELEEEEGVKDLYDKKMVCLFESSFVKATNDMNTEFKNDFFGKIFDPQNPYVPVDRKMKTTDCGEMELNKIFQKQRQNGYETLCKIDGRTSTIETPYSSCRVAEVAWNEFCAYQEYLVWKKQDETLFLEFRKRGEASDSNEYIPSGEYFNSTYLPDERVKYSREIENSYRILSESLEQYHTFEPNYRIYLWENVIIESLKVTREKYTLIRKALETWSKKFHNASAL